ncbi:coproporphyrinogen III oxidase [Methylomonas sp. UP202]|uniref:coproporphyrinogen III oxidase n=1 Tax=Methylomonas sp. UP202 TaxID=3040943 RepID=UPI00247A5BC5|nr:coproporphyrinogen III oxidase [Methylomonas sp. UP202]WGS86768.1 coproporphyrinogen III oxidase [Methylomonas sp. UP202]
MPAIHAKSPRAERAYAMLRELRRRFVSQLNPIAVQFGDGQPFEPIEWLRDQGRHGGGARYMATDRTAFNRASVNTSQVQYDDDPAKKLASASALSTIIHPNNPLAPSVHIHISWTEMKDGNGYWRMMADLNPSNPIESDTTRFTDSLKQAAPALYGEAARQGDRYFYIPALQRHRGVSHFYLENHNSGDFDADLALAQAVGTAAIDTYCAILAAALATRTQPSAEQRQRQLDYHTLYLFQVLTLDRGTTSGLLVHDQNDVGILASLPARIHRSLLASWLAAMPAPQDALLRGLLACLPETDPCPIEDATKQAFAACLRQHYTAHPEAIDLQASGNSIPPTVSNHR